MPTRTARRCIVPIAGLLVLTACVPGATGRTDAVPEAVASSAGPSSAGPSSAGPSSAGPPAADRSSSGAASPSVTGVGAEVGTQAGTQVGAEVGTQVDAEVDAAVVDVPPVSDGFSVAGLVPHQETVLQPDDQRGIATVTFPGVDSLGEVLTTLVDAEVGRYEGARRADGVNVLTVGWGLVQATGDVLGVRLTSRSYTGGAPHGTTTTTTSVYTDVATGQTWTATELVADPARLAGWVTAALAEADLAGEPPAPAVVASDVRFDRDGSVTVVLDRQETGLGTLDAVAVRIPAADAVAVLSGPGRRVRDAAVVAEGFRGVPAGPAEPSAGPPATGDHAVDCTRLACVALTFDDGPGPYTAQLLDELADAGAPATFFVLGGSIAAMPDLVRRAAAEGHAIGSHTWSHSRLPLLTGEQIADEVDRTTAALFDAGVTTDLLRPPYGETDARVADVVGDLGYAQVLWDVDTQDWLNRDVVTTTQRALDGAGPGAVVLMHDIHPTTVQAVPGIIDALRTRGYTLVTVPQLLGAVDPGAVYRGD